MAAVTGKARAVRWDPLVRLTHWLIAAAIVVNGLISEEGSSLHIWVGYAAGALLAVRLLWGVIGTRPARFSSFPPSPAGALRHVREIVSGRHAEHVSHNPLGALMAYALWATLAVVVATGVAMDQGKSAAPLLPRQEQGIVQPALGGEEEEEEGERGGGEGDETLEEVHEIAANLLFLLAALHVAGVAFETRRSGSGLVRAMITGRGKQAPSG